MFWAKPYTFPRPIFLFSAAGLLGSKFLPAVSLHLYQLFIQLIFLLWLRYPTADAEPQCLLLTSPFVEETAISLASKRNNCSLNHTSLPLHTIMLRDDLQLFLVIISLHSLHNVTALFPESTSGQNSHFPPKYCWVFIEYIPFFVKQGRVSWRDNL